MTSSQQGTVTCDKVSCPTLTCSSPMPMAGQCCPVCPKLCQYEGLSYDDGETFSPPNSPCQECLCRQGRVQCKRSMCPQTLCRHPRREGCCPVCNGGCSFISFTISICFLFFVFCPSIQPSIYGPSTSVSLSVSLPPPPIPLSCLFPRILRNEREKRGREREGGRKGSCRQRRTASVSD